MHLAINEIFLHKTRKPQILPTLSEQLLANAT